MLPREFSERPRAGDRLPRQSVDDLGERKVRLAIDGVSGVASIRDFGGLYIVHGRYLLEPAVALAAVARAATSASRSRASRNGCFPFRPPPRSSSSCPLNSRASCGGTDGGPKSPRWIGSTRATTRSLRAELGVRDEVIRVLMGRLSVLEGVAHDRARARARIGALEEHVRALTSERDTAIALAEEQAEVSARERDEAVGLAEERVRALKRERDDAVAVAEEEVRALMRERDAAVELAETLHPSTRRHAGGMAG